WKWLTKAVEYFWCSQPIARDVCLCQGQLLKGQDHRSTLPEHHDALDRLEHLLSNCLLLIIFYHVSTSTGRSFNAFFFLQCYKDESSLLSGYGPVWSTITGHCIDPL